MAWIESHQSLSRHRKTIRAAGRLSVDRATLIGHLHILWWWGLDNVGVDGCLGDMDAFEVATAAEWNGDAELFVDALTDAGFLDHESDGYYLHDWYDYAGKLIERREAERERSRQRRAARRKGRSDQRSDNDDPGGDRDATDGRPADDQPTTVGTVPNRTVPNQTKEIKDNVAPPGPTLPDDPPEPKHDEESIPYRLALHLRSAILHRDPDTRVPAESPKALESWAVEADRMVRLDKRDPREAAELMAWSQQDPFWSGNILSMPTFRRQYDKLKRQRDSRASPTPFRQPVNRETAIDRRLREEGIVL